jgi:polar amino acid transport system substrate-binding protein
VRAVLIGAMIAMGLGLLAREAAAQESKLFEVLKRGQVIVGVTSEVPPFGSVDGAGNLEGFDIDIARLVAKSLFEDPNKIQFQKIAFPARWNAVATGQVDFGIMVTTIWPDRLARVNFTRGYIRSGIAVLARSDVPVRSIKDLNDAKYTMAILNTPSETKLMKDGLPKAKVLILDSEADMLTAVRTGRAHALLIDVPVAAWRASNLPNLKNLGLIGPRTQNAIFLRQNDFQWWWYLDAVVQEMRCGSLFDDYAAVYKKWFGVMPPPPESCLAFTDQEWRDAIQRR